MKEARLVMKPNKYTKNAIDRVSLQGDTPIKAGLYILQKTNWWKL